MTVFGKYSSYYNLLYRDKDYAGEAEYVHNLIKRHCPKAKNILDLGCGTGKHDFLLADKGYAVTGVDLSEDMLAVANENLSSSGSTLSFIHGDIRTVRLNRKFDVVISLFHVLSYQTTNEALRAAIETAKIHLNEGGIFIFDCWYGPAVLTDKPTVRVKRLEDDLISVVRIAEPVMHHNDNIVDVNYTVFIKDKSNEGVEGIKETHRMRYLFKPEIDLLCAENDLEIIEMKEWMTDREPGMKSWSACFVAKYSKY